MFFPFNSAFPVTNVVQYDNPEVDQALEGARSAVDPDERANLLVEAQAQIVADQPWIVYAWPDVLMPLNNRLTTDYEPNGFWYFQDWLSQIGGA
jgi:ABC-type transport system substrate-binding protein